MMKHHNFEHHHRCSGNTITKALHITGWVLVGVILAVIFAFVFAFLVKLFWNGLMPDIFGVKTITYWQAFGLIILAKLLFGGFGLHSHPRGKKGFQRWRKFRDNDEDAESQPIMPDDTWRSYKQYWHEEGKAAFEAYLERIEQEKQSDNSRTHDGGR